IAVADEAAIRAALDVDESRCDDQAARVDALSRARRAERAAWGDTRDAVAADADVAVEPPGTRPVDDPAVLDDDIERSNGRGGGLRTAVRARRESGEEGEQRGEREAVSEHGGGVEGQPCREALA